VKRGKQAVLGAALAFVMAVSTGLWGEIVEVEHITAVNEYVTPTTLVVFDLDNTVIEPAQALGSEQWFQHYLNKLLDSGMEADEAVDQTVALLDAVQNLTEVRLVEYNTRDIIAGLQEAGVAVMAVTSRGA